MRENGPSQRRGRRYFLRLSSLAALSSRLSALTTGLAHSGVSAIAGGARSKDAYIKQKGTEWALGTDRARRVVELRDGRLVMKSFRNEVSRRELASEVASDEFIILTGGNGSSPGGWKFVAASEKLKQGELQLDITLLQGDLQATRSYVIYPESSIVREWTAFRNVGRSPVRLFNPSFLSKTFHPGKPGSFDLYWITSAATSYVPAFSWKLEKEILGQPASRSFDSYDGLPEAPPEWRKMSGDVDMRVLLNDKQVWPASGWQYVPDVSHLPTIDFALDVSAGDKLAFVVNSHGCSKRDKTRLDPTVTYADGEFHTASREFSTNQGENGWKYQYLENGEYLEMVYNPWRDQWRLPDSQSWDIRLDAAKMSKYVSGISPFGWDGPYITLDAQCPGDDQDVARVWIAPKSGHVQVRSTVAVPYSIGNYLNGLGKGAGFKLGPNRYAPWYALLNRDSKDGILISWAYFGHWSSSFDVGKHDDLSVKLVTNQRVSLAPGKTIKTPEAITGVFRDDLDEAGNEFLDWQYGYMWDYTRDKWFPKVRMLGYWWPSTQYLEPENPWSSDLGTDVEGIRKNAFRVADLMRYCGGDVWHEDWGWWRGPLGDWNDPDWRSVNQYLGKSGIGLLIYTWLYWADKGSKVAREHPEWLRAADGSLDVSKPEVVAHLEKVLDSFYQRWGDFEWRNDGHPLGTYNGDDETPFMEIDQIFRQIMRDFLEQHPGCAIELCDGFADAGDWDYLRYTSALQTAEEGLDLRRNYYSSLLYPPDKTSDTYSCMWDPDNYEKRLWRGLLCINFDMEGDTWKPEKLEGVRELIDIYHYLHKHDVVGRWVKVFRPQIVGDDPVMYFH